MSRAKKEKLPAKREYFLRFFLILCSSIFSFFILEVSLQYMQEAEEKSYIWTPNTTHRFNPVPGVMPGVSGSSLFAVNSEGMRGDPYFVDYDYKILAVGGSTTECLYLDQSESWPYLLQGVLREESNANVFVGNVGRSGNNTRHHYYQIKYLLDQYPDIDLILVLVGINDLHLYLSDPSYKSFNFADSAQKSQVIKNAFALFSAGEHDISLPFYAQSAVLKSLLSVKNVFRKKDRVQDDAGNWYAEVRDYRRQAKKILSELPDMTVGLVEYRNNLHAIIDLVEGKNVRFVLMTQPVMWSGEGTKEYEELYWLGGIGDFMHGKADAYYSADVLANAMEQYNNALLEICTERQIECIDLASMLPKDTSVFYDDVHFNEPGAKRVADIVAEYLGSTGKPQ
jgi:lysophospholipase L1-like esterase